MRAQDEGYLLKANVIKSGSNIFPFNIHYYNCFFVVVVVLLRRRRYNTIYYQQSTTVIIINHIDVVVVDARHCRHRRRCFSI